MAKKINTRSKPKKLKRASSMEKVIAEGKQFLSQKKKKKSQRTRTMTETLKDAQNMNQSKGIIKRKQVNKSEKKKIIQKKTTSKRPTKKAVRAKKLSPKELMQINKLSSSNISNGFQGNLKRTIFKTSSNQKLIIPSFGFIDICFCIDATGSMTSELAQVQSAILQLIEKISNKVSTEGLTLRFAIVTYRDHPPQEISYVTKVLDFTDGYEASQYVKKLQAYGGGDFPEAVHDGLMACCKQLRWVQLPDAPVLRYIFHIADAPPHGKQFGNLCEQKQGCLCGMKIKDVFDQINKRDIHFRLIKCRAHSLTSMEQKFKKGIRDFHSTELVNAKELNIRVSDMVIRQMIA